MTGTSDRMQFFLPDWDDRVDPGYDFTCDRPSPDRDPYTSDVYAHEIFDSPPFDGILVSKSVIEGNPRKKDAVLRSGIHAYLRLPENIPVIGDCGAFSYVDAKVPPYETDETVQFYQDLGCNYGVSIDHLIVPSVLKRKRYRMLSPSGDAEEIDEAAAITVQESGIRIASGQEDPDLFRTEPVLEITEEYDPGEAQRRWDLTLENAQEFIETHKRLRCTFEPIAACQGWDVDSQTEMFAEQQAMGYGYIALGGLIRSKTEQIIELLEKVQTVRRPETKVHLFGVARPEALQEFKRLGVNSVDSARFLRQAWLSAKSNYYVCNGKNEPGERLKTYTAIRVPPLTTEDGKMPTPLARSLVEDGADMDMLLNIERSTIRTCQAFDRGDSTAENVMACISEYCQLIGKKNPYEEEYARLLRDRPWQSCPCPICRTSGIDVAIFRRNNRNRRRGFHNTWCFYQYFRNAVTDRP